MQRPTPFLSLLRESDDKKYIYINRNLHNCHSMVNSKGKRKLNQSKGIRSTESRGWGEIFNGMVRVVWFRW